MAKAETMEAIEVDESLTADLARLEAQVMDGAADQARAAQEPEAVQRIPAEQSLAGLLGMLQFAGHLGFGSLSAVWNDAACAEVAGRACAVFRKYAWGGRMIEFLEEGTGAEELALGAVLVPALIGSYAAIKSDLAEPEKADGETEKAHKLEPVA